MFDPEEPPESEDMEPATADAKLDIKANVELSASYITNAVVHEVARQVLAGTDYRERINDVVKVLNNAIDERVTALAEQTVSSATTITIQPRNNWGEPQGKPMELRDLILDRASKFLNEKVDADGRAGSYGEHKFTRAELIVKKMVEEVFSRELSGEIRKIANEVKAKMSETATLELAERIKQAFR